jgi:hypothetical protein
MELKNFNTTDGRIDVFEKIVLEQFSFLEINYQFKPPIIQRWEDHQGSAIKYTSDKVFVHLSYWTFGSELNSYFGRIGIEDQKNGSDLSFAEIWTLEDLKNEIEVPSYCAYSKENIEVCVQKLGKFLEKYGHTYLTGDEETYNLLYQRRQERDEAGEKISKINDIKKAAAEAWEKEDYGQVVKLYESIQNEITPVESQKLRMAKNRL